MAQTGASKSGFMHKKCSANSGKMMRNFINSKTLLGRLNSVTGKVRRSIEGKPTLYFDGKFLIKLRSAGNNTIH